MRPLVMLDMDETLLHSVENNKENYVKREHDHREHSIRRYVKGDIKAAQGLERIADEYAAIVAAYARVRPSKQYISIPNPEAETAIALLAASADICIFTAATREYAIEALTNSNLIRFFGSSIAEQDRKVICLDEPHEMRNSTNRPWALIDDLQALGKVREVYPKASIETCAELVVRVEPFTVKNLRTGNGLVVAAQEALRRVTSPAWGVRCPTSGKRTARQNPPQTLTTASGVNLSFCCAEHKRDFKL
jgi:hypothetical protein